MAASERRWELEKFTEKNTNRSIVAGVYSRETVCSYLLLWIAFQSNFSHSALRFSTVQAFNNQRFIYSTLLNRSACKPRAFINFPHLPPENLPDSVFVSLSHRSAVGVDSAWVWNLASRENRVVLKNFVEVRWKFEMPQATNAIICEQ